jgi:hypothetical protein
VSWVYCNVSLEGRVADINGRGVPVIAMTMFMPICGWGRDRSGM